MSGAPPLAARGDPSEVGPAEGLERGLPGAGGRLLPAGLGPAREEDPTWCLAIGEEEGDVDGAKGRAAEALLCVADGTIGTRGVLEDHDDTAAGVLVAGLYRPAPDVTETLMALPGWCSLPLAEGLPSGRRVLDLRDGLLTRVAAGPNGRISTARFACVTRPGTAVMAAEGPRAVWSAKPETSDVAPTVVRSPLGGAAAKAVTTTTNNAEGGGAYRLERVAVYLGSPRRPPRVGVASRRLEEAARLGAARLLAEQRDAWAVRWATGDVEVVGDPEMTLAARFALFHLRSSARTGGEAAVGARGLTGQAYAGHVFWDTDVFVLPVLAAVDPAAARAVLAYRLRRLPAARARATFEGRQGARFPWESARDGSDVSPRSGADQHGEMVPIRTGDLEEHVTADVAWAAWAFAAWSGRWSYLEGPGRPLLMDTARYWASRVSYDRDGKAHIEGVIGPDEYHERVDDNAFTNLMARWNLRLAADVADRTGLGSPEADEAQAWRRAADSLVDGYDPASGLYEQFAGYFDLEPLLAKDLGPVPLAADLVLGRARLAASQLVKQADVLMAHHLVPDEVRPGSLAANLDFYLARTVHGSSLSPSVHAALLARAGRADEALKMLRLAAAVDMEDLTETTAGGLHLANLGGIWQAMVAGFAGLRPPGPADTALQVDPVLPEGWDELRVALFWRGRPLRLIFRSDAVYVGCERPLRVVVHGSRARITPPGRWVS